jgi:peroxiredoxin
LNELQKEYEAKGFVIVGVSQDDTAAQIADFEKDFPIDYTVLTGGAKFANDFGVVSFPTSFVIDREGRIHKRIVGEVTRERDEAIIKTLTEQSSTTEAK